VILLVILISVLLTVILGSVSFNGFYQAFKININDDDLDIFPVGFEFFSIIAMILGFVLWICKKFFPIKICNLIYRIFSFLFGLVFLMLIVLVWVVIPF
jgi:hypothetical protein